MKDSSMDENDFSTETSENETIECDENEMSVEEPKKTIHDHPFSIESILNGRTKRRKPKLAKSSVEGNTLPLNALEEFTNNAFSAMRPERIGDKDEGTLLFYFLFWPIFHKLDTVYSGLTD